MAKPSGWDRAAWLLIILHSFLLLAWWSFLPFFVDHYYHLNVLQGFRDAGGVVLHDFWEYAPQGRPHLYPPALHLGLLLLDGLRLNPINIARVASLLSYVALLSVTWMCARRWLQGRLAYWVILANCLPWSYLLVSCNTIAASWAMVWWLMSLLAIQRRAVLAAALFGALVFYTHLGSPWLMLFSWGVWGLCDRPIRRTLAMSALGSLFFASPWLAHLWHHRSSIVPVSTMENALLELPLGLYAAAGLGMVALIKEKAPTQVRSILWGLLAGLTPLAVHYRFRFFSGQGLLGISFFAGIGLAFLHSKCEKLIFPNKNPYPWLAAALFTLLCFLLHPVHFPGNERQWVLGDTAFSHLALQDERVPRSNAVSFYYPQYMDPLVERIRQLTSPDELIACNQPYACGLLAALSRRAMTIGMLAEVRADESSEASAIGAAQLLVWFKGAGVQEMALERQLQQRLSLNLVAETEMARLWRNPTAKQKRKIAHPVLPLWAAQALLLLAVGAAFADFLRPN